MLCRLTRQAALTSPSPSSLSSCNRLFRSFQQLRMASSSSQAPDKPKDSNEPLKSIWKGRFLQILGKKHKSHYWEYCSRSNANGVVAVLPMTTQGNLLLLEQHRVHLSLVLCSTLCSLFPAPDLLRSPFSFFISFSLSSFRFRLVNTVSRFLPVWLETTSIPPPSQRARRHQRSSLMQPSESC